MPKIKIRTSKEEIIDITKAWIAISVAFAFVLKDQSTSFIESAVISAIAVGLGFLLHELSHKILAQHYGCWAEFRSWDLMLVVAVLLAAVFGFVFAAPGAVFISGLVGISRNGRISVAGPIMNLVLAVIFFTLLITFPSGLIGKVSQYGMSINTWLAVFNLLPFGPLDGKKVLAWNKTVYFAVIGIAILMMLSLNSLASLLI